MLSIRLLRRLLLRLIWGRRIRDSVFVLVPVLLTVTRLLRIEEGMWMWCREYLRKVRD